MANKRQRTNNIIGAGTYAVDILPKYRAEAQRIDARQTILTEGRADFNLMTTSTGSKLGGEGVMDVSPPPSQIKMVMGLSGKQKFSEQNREYWEEVANAMVDRISTAQEQAGLYDSQCLWCQGLGTGHADIAEHMVRKLKRVQPRMKIATDVVVPHDFDKLDERVVSGYNLFTNLWEEGIIEGTLLTDNNSPFAKTYTLKVADNFKVTAIMSWILAPKQFKQNRGVVESIISLGDFGPFTGMAFASETLAIKKETFWWPLFKPVVNWVPKGTLSLPNIIIKSEEAFEQALHNPNNRAIAEEVDTKKPFFAIFSIPLGVDEVWSDITAQIRKWMSNKYPTAVPIFASAPGVPMPRASGAYHLQCSLVYPLPANPTAIVEIIGRKNLKIRQRKRTSEAKVVKLDSLNGSDSFSKSSPQWRAQSH